MQLKKFYIYKFTSAVRHVKEQETGEITFSENLQPILSRQRMLLLKGLLKLEGKTGRLKQLSSVRGWYPL